MARGAWGYGLGFEGWGGLPSRDRIFEEKKTVMPYLHEKDIEMSIRPLIAKEMEPTDVLAYTCGCQSVWTGEKWIPEHEQSLYIKTEVPCKHWVEEQGP